MRIHSAELFASAASPSQFPPPGFPEIAFAGRSNVGKSTLINSLLNRKKLVKTSSTPGKTQLINFFAINQVFCLVDLPGYGYAKVPENVRRNWRHLIESYLAGRQKLNGVVLIVDIRHGPTAQDRQLREWLMHHQRPVLVVAGKSDKLSRGQTSKQLEVIRRELQLDARPIPHSSLNKSGRAEIWTKLREWIQV